MVVWSSLLKGQKKCTFYYDIRTGISLHSRLGHKLVLIFYRTNLKSYLKNTKKLFFLLIFWLLKFFLIKSLTNIRRCVQTWEHKLFYHSRNHIYTYPKLGFSFNKYVAKYNNLWNWRYSLYLEHGVQYWKREEKLGRWAESESRWWGLCPLAVELQHNLKATVNCCGE